MRSTDVPAGQYVVCESVKLHGFGVSTSGDVQYDAGGQSSSSVLSCAVRPSGHHSPTRHRRSTLAFDRVYPGGSGSPGAYGTTHMRSAAHGVGTTTPELCRSSKQLSVLPSSPAARHATGAASPASAHMNPGGHANCWLDCDVFSREELGAYLPIDLELASWRLLLRMPILLPVLELRIGD